MKAGTSTKRHSLDWYLDQDPMAVVDPSLVDLVHANGGHSLLDLGAGAGGYSKRLEELGHEVLAYETHQPYVDMARSIGVDAHHYDGKRLPLEDDSVDTVFLLEVLEHVPDFETVVREAARVARKNVIATVPNCTQTFAPAPVVFEHMVVDDHVNFFTVDSFGDLFRKHAGHVEVTQLVPVDRMLLDQLLLGPAHFAYRVINKLKPSPPRYFFRLLAIAEVA